MRQRLPFHRSASGSVGLEAVEASEPTAVQARAETHATDDSTLISAPTGFGVGSTFHLRAPASLGPPACAPAAMTIAVNPSTTVNDPSSRVARRRRAPA
jgi:hypothetical protein